jgi:hypothetical protein
VFMMIRGISQCTEMLLPGSHYSVITNIFEPDIMLHDGNRTSSPHITTFVSELIPRLAVLYQIGPKTVECSSNHISLRSMQLFG